MTIGKGIAIAGIWIGVAIACFAPTIVPSVAPLVFIFAFMATSVLALFSK